MLTGSRLRWLPNSSILINQSQTVYGSLVAYVCMGCLLQVTGVTLRGFSRVTTVYARKKSAILGRLAGSTLPGTTYNYLLTHID